MDNAAIVTTIREFRNTYSRDKFTSLCHLFVENECDLPVGEANDRSWNNCFDFLVANLPKDSDYGDYHIIFEYMMPESMKRSDVIILSKHKVIILEFKQKNEIIADDVAQVYGYSRSIHQYHYMTSQMNMEVIPCMVYTLDFPSNYAKLIPILNSSNFTQHLCNLLAEEQPLADDKCEMWIKSPYCPLRSLVDSTLQLFRDGELPNIKTIREGDIQEVLDIINGVIANNDHKKNIVFVTGVPGAGKTLVGLKTVYDHGDQDENYNPIFLSGNDPLVNILQHTLSTNQADREGESYIQSMKYFKRLAYGDRIPLNQIIVFDEAQRAWDTDRRNANETEATLLLSIADKIAGQYGKVTIVCLIGEGQAIHKHEETGMPIWSNALAVRNDWKTYIPDKFEGLFSDVSNTVIQPKLFLNTSIRNDFIDVSPWVEAVLALDLEKAKMLYQYIFKQGFRCMYFCNREKLFSCVEYIRKEYPQSHTGLILSSHIKKNLKDIFGTQYRGSYIPADDAYQWYQYESFTLRRGASEFLIQGIELDYPIVAFVGDYYIKDGKWVVDDEAIDPGLQDLQKVLENVYRVLLTRSRKGMFLYFPKIEKMVETVCWFKSMLEIDIEQEDI